MSGRAKSRHRKVKTGFIIRTAAMLMLLGGLALLFIMPIALTITNSLMSQTEIAANYGKIFTSLTGDRTYVSDKVQLKLIPDIISFSQYLTAFVKTPDYLLKFWNSVILVVPIMVFQIIIALAAAYCFARFDSKLRSIIFFSYIILMLMPYQVTLVPNYIVAGWFNIRDTRWSIILPGIFSPFAVFILARFMRRIPSSVYEAAKLDGCGEWQIFTKICIPLCRGVIYSVAILVFIDYWNMVEQPLVLLGDDALHPLSVFLSKINASDAGVAFAVAAVYMIPPLLVFLYSEDYLIEGVAYSGSIKG
ncbi:MAG: carbohydrate ABC transporter permease [Clostridiales bacterium]|nr:carbohydrate ABC transporter permease [Clostridiales bacterium]